MISSFERLFKDRVSSPLFSTFIVSWLLWNWRIIYLSFFVDAKDIQPFNKIDFIAEYYSSYWFTIVFPLVSTFALIFVVPFAENWTYKRHLKFKEDRRKMKEESEKDKMVSGEDFFRQRREYLDNIRQVEEELIRRKNEVSELNKTITGLLHDSEKLQVAYAGYGILEDMKDVTNDVRKGISPNNELNFQIRNNAFNIPDPAPGKIKEFMLVLRIGGEFKTIRAKEGDSINVDRIGAKVIEKK